MVWYENEHAFDWDKALPQQLAALAGPHGPALLDVYPSGKTSPGWGLAPHTNARGKTFPGFMTDYAEQKFWARPRVLDFTRNDRPFAIVMRSLNVVMVDIDRHLSDGGADGFVSATEMDLPLTLAETSKSGAGRHLFYRTAQVWDEASGFGEYDDVIGLAPGVDVRAVGCSFRYVIQRWNHEEIAPIPDWLHDRLLERKARKSLQAQMFAATAEAPDTEEALVMHDALLQELAKPIPPGKRNVTLFAIGHKLHAAQVPDWQDALRKRAHQVGISDGEVDKIVANIAKYPTVVTP